MSLIELWTAFVANEMGRSKISNLLASSREPSTACAYELHASTPRVKSGHCGVGS